MKEHAHLETWLRSTERAVTCAGPAHISYVSAKEKLRRMEVSWTRGRTGTPLFPARSPEGRHPCVSEAAVGGGASAGPVRQPDSEESNPRPAVSGRHASSAAGSGEVVRAAVRGGDGGVGVRRHAAGGSEDGRSAALASCKHLQTSDSSLSALRGGLGGL